MAQVFNWEAMLYSPYVFIFKKRYAIPHAVVKDIRALDPAAMKDAGIKGVLFDKDNTLTSPFDTGVYPAVSAALTAFKEAFPGKTAIFSNWAGTHDDSKGRAAAEIEKKMGLPVIRHACKKPGGLAEVKRAMGLSPAEMAIVGDRILTDIVFGNRYGLLTIHVGPLMPDAPRSPIGLARAEENKAVLKWKKQGLTPPSHPADVLGIVKTGQGL